MQMIHRLLLVVTFLSLWSGHVWALSLVNKPLAVEYPNTGFTSKSGDQNMIEHFTLSQAAILERVSWSGFFSPGLTASSQFVGDFDVLFFANDPNSFVQVEDGPLVESLPHHVPFYQASFMDVVGVSTGLSNYLFGGVNYEWTVDLPMLSLQADKYWIDIRGSSSEPDYFIWGNSVAPNGYLVFSSNPEETVLCTVGQFGCDPNNRARFQVNAPSQEMAFSITGTNVPEPSTWKLLALSLGLVGLSRLRRTR